MTALIRLLAAGLWLACASLAAQPIYRVVDENGNVTYTDQKPSDDAEPMELPDINVITGSDPALEEIIDPETGDSDIEPFRMTIAEPGDGSIIANAEGRLDIRFESNLDIPPAAQLVVFVNDRPQPPLRSLEMSLTDLPAGEYRLRAELQTPSGRKLADSDSVTVRLIATDSG
ncbi:MAG: DUF4124 domain-containing protein [Wenzhouxiangella sp.]